MATTNNATSTFMATFFIDATAVAAARAMREGTLVRSEEVNRFGETYIALEDEHGLLTTFPTMKELQRYLANLIKHLGD